MERVSVVGTSGSGKSTLARRLSEALGAPHVELDALYHQPGWQPADPADFRAGVDRLTAGPRWVVDGNYSAVRDLVWSRADTVVAFDLPRAVVMGRVLRRTLHRVVSRTELWNGNKESWRNLVRRDPARNIVLWAWTTHAAHSDRLRTAFADPAHDHLRFVKIASPADADRLVATVRRTGRAPG